MQENFNELLINLNKLLQGEYVKDVQSIVKRCQEKRSLNRHFNNGFSSNKKVRVLASIPYADVFIDVEKKKYFDPQASSYERRKDIKNFLKKNPKYLLVDNMDWK